MEDDQTRDENSYFITPLVTPGGLAVSECEKAESLDDSLEAQFQLVSAPLDPATIEMVDVSLRVYSFAPASELKLNNSDEVQEAIRDLNVGKAPGPDGIPNRASSMAGDLLPRHDLQCYPHHPVFPIGVEAPTCDLHPEAGEGSTSTLVLSTHESARHDWQVV